MMLLPKQFIRTFWPLIFYFDLLSPSISISATNEFLETATNHFNISGSYCQKPSTIHCNIDDKYLTPTPFNNSLGHASAFEADSDLAKYYYLFNVQDCGHKMKLFLCSIYFPVCIKGVPLPDGPRDYIHPCQEICWEAKEACSLPIRKANDTWRPTWDCERFPAHGLCFTDKNRDSSRSRSSSADTLTDINAYSDPRIPYEPRSRPIEIDRVEHACEEGLFDCKMAPSANGSRRAFCIQESLVCDGREDCVTDNLSDPNFGLDERNCEKCPKDRLACDGKCIESNQICDGKVDCVEGADEVNCNGRVYIGVLESLLGISVFIILLFASIRRLNRNRQTREDPSNIIEEPIMQEPSPEKPPPYMIRHEVPPQSHDLISQQQVADPNPIYQEPSSYYERLNAGGRSGASSVYTYGAYAPWTPHSQTFNHASSLNYLDERSKEPSWSDLPAPPPAPPPTPLSTSCLNFGPPE